MQVKTQLLIEDILCYIGVILFVCVMLYVTGEDDNDTDTDFPKHEVKKVEC